MTTLTEVTPHMLGPNQIKWIERVYGHVFFRKGQRFIQHTHCQLPEKLQ